MTAAMTPAWLLATFTQSCTIMARKEAGTDPYGDVVYVDQEVATFPCLCAPVNASEIQRGRTGVSDFTLFLPADAGQYADEFSRFIVDGVSYEADGPAMKFTPLFAPHLHHVEVQVVRSSA